MEYFYAIIAGTFYGLTIGIIPGAGATTGLVALYPFVGLLLTLGDPYLGVVFLMAVVAASTTGDTYTSVLLGIPGANSAAATVVDGFPLAQQGKAAYAISAAVTVSTINGLLWGSLVFLLLPWYSNLIMFFGIPELWAFTLLAFVTVVFVANRYWIRSIVALSIGLYFGLVGVDPTTASDRFTLGWDYLGGGIQIMPLVAGLFAVPELLAGFKRKAVNTKTVSNFQQTRESFSAVWQNRWLALRGGFIGAFVGVLPGLGGAVADWMSYGQTIATNPDEKIKFGSGNIKGVIGPEGANNAQKASSMIPTVLFGIPGAPFAAILMSLFMFLGLEMGTPLILEDQKFFTAMTFGFLTATVLVAFICVPLTPAISRAAQVNYAYYFPILLLFIVWACVQYTGGWEDYAVLGIFSLLGIACKRYRFSRPALLIGYMLADRIESLSLQLTTLYSVEQLVQRPLFLSLIAGCIGVVLYFVFKRNSIDYA